MTETDRKLEILTPPEAQGSAGKHSNRYLLFDQIGSGGMASVYVGCLAGAEGFERLVAIKRIHEHLAKEPVFRDMFLDEARVAATLQHPNLVQVTDFGLEGVQPYLVMEYINGESLSVVLRHCQELTRSIPVVIGARILAWAAEGLHAAHETLDLDGRPQKVVHRDISPHNILVSYDGVVKVTDFGIAKAARRITSTDTGQIKGKLAYMSPEQAQARPLDRRSDIFSLGIVLYETTMGRRLFKQANKFETLRSIIMGTYPKPRTLEPTYPEELEKIVVRALEPRLSDRYQTAREMQRDLERFFLKDGVPVGSAEVAEFMHAIFEQRIASKAAMVANAARGEPTETHGEVDLTGSTTLTRTTLKKIEPRSTPTRRLEPILVGMLFGIATMVLVLIGASWWMSATRPTETTSGLASGLADPSDRSSIPADRPRGERVTPRPEKSATPAGVPSSNVVTESHDASPSTDADGASSETVKGEGKVPMSSAIRDSGPPMEQRNEPDDANEAPPNEPPAEKVKSAAKITPRPPLSGRKTAARPRPGRQVELEPQPEPGWLSIMAHPWCEVYHNGRRLGRTPLVRVRVPSGRQVLLFLPEGKRPAHRFSVNVKAGRETPVSFKAP